MEITDINAIYGPLCGVIGLIIVLAKMHNDISTLKEKVKTLFDIHNSR